ncbi:splicing factor 1-like [Limulus polyphemus]|uniref:Splicing factor 1-like n=1 Tax=Limulus polyphemus TaxID=6850 RepID=A0ABM1C1S5_LIMPO|nr:splicing factor 1-like [Limulus polyphemus]
MLLLARLKGYFLCLFLKPGLTIHGVPPAPNLLTQPPPPPPPTTQPTVSTSVPWMNPQHTTGSQGNAMATVLPPWQPGNPSQSMGAAPMPVPPPHSNPVSGSQSFPWLTTGYMGVPPPPPVQPPLPPNLAAPPPPPPPACNTVTTTSQAVDLNNLTQSGLPSLLTAPPPPPPS